ncbi:MAG TPA: PEP/pyruvate-binding domain-containing protein, partial [Patescibacteria group bacterium]|nr:PEP/pyruvate-binding domain-containing protein [Patescibacteria group bacterium]
MSKFIKFFDELSNKDVPKVGGKNASLGEMYSKLKKSGVRVPNGFATTADAYDHFMEKAGLKKKIRQALEGLDPSDVNDLYKRGEKVRNLILKADVPQDLKDEIKKAYKELSKQSGVKNLDVAVRSSATAEDLPDASFAGQQETYLNIKGEVHLQKAIKKCIASLFTNRAISYREDKDFDHFDIALSVGVQKMIRSDLASSGVMFSLDTESGFENVVLVNSIYGLGENIVQGKVNPDEFWVFKPTNAIISRSIGAKSLKMIYNNSATNPTKDIKVNKKDQEKQSITDEDVKKLAEWAVMIEKHYKTPMDMEWALDGKENKLYIIQARPETVNSVKDKNVIERYELEGSGDTITTGQSVGDKIGNGTAHKIMDLEDIKKFKKGEVLVTDMTDPDWEPIMKIASAIVTDKGGRTCFSGDTPILTDKGFLKIKQITKKHIKEGIRTPSLNKETGKIEWRAIVDVMNRNSETIKVNFSQTGRNSDNYLHVTPDHRFVTLNNRTLIEEQIEKILKNKDMVLAADNLPTPDTKNISAKLAYLWGAILTDGSIYLTQTHGEVQLIQKQTPEKEEFINTVKKYFQDVFKKELKTSPKKSGEGKIRGKEVEGEATAFRCYSKEIATKFKGWQNNLTTHLLSAPLDANRSFLAGVMDGDGSFNKKASRINLYISSENLLQGVIISCLKLNILPQVTQNRDIYNVQIPEKIEELTRYAHRLQAKDDRQTNGVKLLAAKQLFEDIAELINFKGRIKPYINKNLLLDKDKIENNILPLLKGKVKNITQSLLDSDFVSLRASSDRKKTKEKVYNITVEGNHNYLAFTSKYTPIIVKNCHAAIVSRELGIPCVVGTGDVSEKVNTKEDITVDASQGETGYIYEGKLDYKINTTDIKNLKKPQTQMMMNVGSPDLAFPSSFVPNDGIGLARLEFIINNHIKIHPLALLDYRKLKDKELKKKIDEITGGFEDTKEFFIQKLAEGVATIAASVYPKDCIVRLSDFKSNEYANLIGGEGYEPEESNPMIGWRGANRYYSEEFLPAFEMECEALRRVREDMGLNNLKIMVPFCRTIEEGKEVKKIMAKNGLKQGKNHLEVYVMAEIPTNILLAEQFAKEFDGFSIGSNDLTQLTLGIDRDAGDMLHIVGQSNEKNESVKMLIRQLIQAAKKHKTKVGICGQAPSDFPDFNEFLVECGIDSISLIPATVVKTTQIVNKAE